MTRSSPSRRTIGALALITGLVLAGCTTAGSSPSASAAPSSLPSASVVPSAPSSEPASAGPSVAATAVPSVEPTESLVAFACVPSVTITKTIDRAQISDVRVGTHAGYDRVTFQFAAGIPQTVIEGVLPPFYADPSDLPIDIDGTAFLKVTMTFGTKVMDGGLTYAGSTNFTPGFPQLVQLREGGDFEAVSSWYIGLNGGGCYRVLTLASPSRLVIDVEH
jgi:hypothetical protein